MTASNLPIAVEMIVAVVKAAAAIAAPIGNAEHAIHRADRAADTGSDRAADHTAYRTGGPVTFVGAFLRAAHDALGMPDMGDREQREGDGRDRQRWILAGKPAGSADVLTFVVFI